MNRIAVVSGTGIMPYGEFRKFLGENVIERMDSLSMKASPREPHDQTEADRKYLAAAEAKRQRRLQKRVTARKDGE